MSRPASRCMRNSSPSHTSEALPESLVPTRTHTERGVRTLTPFPAILAGKGSAVLVRCRWGPSLQLLCASVLFPTTPFIVGTLFSSRMLGFCFFFLPFFFLLFWPQSSLYVTPEGLSKGDNYTPLMCLLGGLTSDQEGWIGAWACVCVCVCTQGISTWFQLGCLVGL